MRGAGTRTREIEAEQQIQKLCYQCDEYANHLFVKDTECPYTHAEGPALRLDPRAARGRQVDHLGTPELPAVRLRPEGRSRDGFGVDWPLDYAELAPYYDARRALQSASAARPRASPSCLTARSCRRCRCRAESSWRARSSRTSSGRTLTIGRCRHPHGTPNGRPACHYCGPCNRGCSTGSYYSSPASSLPAAAATGRLTLIPNAVVSHVELGRHRPLQEHRVHRPHHPRAARGVREVVVLCASTLESTRIMLNSTSDRHPRGLSNGSGALGHYLMDHIMGGGARGRCRMGKKFVDDRRAGRTASTSPLPQHRGQAPRLPAGLRLPGRASMEKWGHAFALPGFGAASSSRCATTARGT
jgi:choline dehydrogenase-like flavoprotein